MEPIETTMAMDLLTPQQSCDIVLTTIRKKEETTAFLENNCLWEARYPYFNKQT